jgi:type VI secretion system protein ImpH
MIENIQQILTQDIKKLSILQLVRLLNIKEKNLEEILKKAHISPNLSLAFTKSDFETIKFEDEHYNIISNFLCLYGTSSVMPTFYTEELMQQENEENYILRAFYDLFNQRTYSLLIEIVLKNRLMLSILEFKDSQAISFINSFLGINKSNLINNKKINSFKLLKYIDILNSSIKSLDSLKIFLKDLFDLDIDIQENIKVQIPIHKTQQNSLAKKNSNIGNNIYLGSKVTDYSSTFKIIIKNISFDNFNQYLPKTKNFNDFLKAINLFLEKSCYYYIIEFDIKDDKTNLENIPLGNINHSLLGKNTFLSKIKRKYTYNSNIKLTIL